MSETDNPASILGEAFTEALRIVIRQEIGAANSTNVNGNGQGAPGMLDVDGIAKALSVEKSWIYEHTRKRENPIPHFKVGRYPRFDLREVKAWLKEKPD